MSGEGRVDVARERRAARIAVILDVEILLMSRIVAVMSFLVQSGSRVRETLIGRAFLANCVENFWSFRRCPVAQSKEFWW